MAYCKILRGRERAEHRRRLAEKMKTTVVALRMRVTRLRGILSDCVRKHSGGESGDDLARYESGIPDIHI